MDDETIKIDPDLTSSIGDSLLSSNNDKTDANDSTPTSSTDAASTLPETASTASEDPISSTSSDVMERDKFLPTLSIENKDVEDSVDKNLLETDADVDLLDMNIANVSSELISEDVEDIVQDLENLLGEPEPQHDFPTRRKEKVPKDEDQPTYLNETLVENTESKSDTSTLEKTEIVEIPEHISTQDSAPPVQSTSINEEDSTNTDAPLQESNEFEGEAELQKIVGNLEKSEVETADTQELSETIHKEDESVENEIVAVTSTEAVIEKCNEPFEILESNEVSECKEDTCVVESINDDRCDDVEKESGVVVESEEESVKIVNSSEETEQVVDENVKLESLEQKPINNITLVDYESDEEIVEASGDAESNSIETVSSLTQIHEAPSIVDQLIGDSDENLMQESELLDSTSVIQEVDVEPQNSNEEFPPKSPQEPQAGIEETNSPVENEVFKKTVEIEEIIIQVEESQTDSNNENVPEISFPEENTDENIGKDESEVVIEEITTIEENSEDLSSANVIIEENIEDIPEIHPVDDSFKTEETVNIVITEDVVENVVSSSECNREKEQIVCDEPEVQQISHVIEENSLPALSEEKIDENVETSAEDAVKSRPESPSVNETPESSERNTLDFISESSTNIVESTAQRTEVVEITEESTHIKDISMIEEEIVQPLEDKDSVENESEEVSNTTISKTEQCEESSETSDHLKIENEIVTTSEKIVEDISRSIEPVVELENASNMEVCEDLEQQIVESEEIEHLNSQEIKKDDIVNLTPVNEEICVKKVIIYEHDCDSHGTKTSGIELSSDNDKEGEVSMNVSEVVIEEVSDVSKNVLDDEALVEKSQVSTDTENKDLSVSKVQSEELADPRPSNLVESSSNDADEQTDPLQFSSEQSKLSEETSEPIESSISNREQEISIEALSDQKVPAIPQEVIQGIQGNLSVEPQAAELVVSLENSPVSDPPETTSENTLERSVEDTPGSTGEKTESVTDLVVLEDKIGSQKQEVSSSIQQSASTIEETTSRQTEEFPPVTEETQVMQDQTSAAVQSILDNMLSEEKQKEERVDKEETTVVHSGYSSYEVQKAVQEIQCISRSEEAEITPAVIDFISSSSEKPKDFEKMEVVNEEKTVYIEGDDKNDSSQPDEPVPDITTEPINNVNESVQSPSDNEEVTEVKESSEIEPIVVPSIDLSEESSSDNSDEEKKQNVVSSSSNIAPLKISTKIEKVSKVEPKKFSPRETRHSSRISDKGKPFKEDFEQPLLVNVDEIEREKPYSPKITIKPIKEDEEEHKGSLKITITKQSDNTHSILKMCSPDFEHRQKGECEEVVPKLVIKTDSDQHSPKISTRSAKQTLPPRSGSPRITIKPIVKPDTKDTITSPLKITIKPIGKPEEFSRQQQKQSPKLIKNKSEDDHYSTRSKVMKSSESSDVHSPKVTIKPVKPPEDSEITTPKITIKPIEEARVSPKITIKPVLRPADLEIEVEDEVKERIVLKINKGNLPEKVGRKRELEEDRSEKLAKIKLKFSKDGDAHIVHKEDDNKFEVERPKRFKPDTADSGDDDVKLIENRPSPIIISEDSQSQDSVIILDNAKDPLALLPVPEPIPQAAPPVIVPRKRGRPRKIPLVVKEDFGTVTQAVSVVPTAPIGVQPTETAGGRGRPKRSCRAQSVRDTLGIKPRKPSKPRGGKRGAKAMSAKAAKKMSKKDK